MSIEVNGVTLPDIPSEVLASYPYVVIAYDSTSEIAENTYCLFTSASMFKALYVDLADSLMYGIPVFIGTMKALIYTLGASVNWETFDEGELEFPLEYSESVGVYFEPLWSNHDIYTATFHIDTATGNTSIIDTDTDTIYFARNDLAATYAVSSDFLVGVADQTRRLTESTDKLTTDEMLEKLKGVEAGSSGGSGLEFDCVATGCIPEYDHGYAASTLTLDNMFESSAVGEVTS